VSAGSVRSQTARRSRIDVVVDSGKKRLSLAEPRDVNGNEVFLSLGYGCMHDSLSPGYAAATAVYSRRDDAATRLVANGILELSKSGSVPNPNAM